MNGAIPESFRRWRVRGARLVPEREPSAAPRAGEVLVAIEAAEVGASEVTLLDCEGQNPGSSGVGVIEASADALSDWMGRRVLVAEALPCGECAICQRGRSPACERAVRPGRNGPGTLASHLVVPVRYLVAADRELTPPEGTPPHALALVAGAAGRIHHALCRAGLAPGELAVFIGDGIESRIGARLAELKAAQAVVVSAKDATWDLIRSRVAEVPKTTRIFETTRSPEGGARAQELALPAGTLSFLGQDGADLALGRSRVLETPILLTGPAHPDLLPELLALVVRKELDLAALCRPVGPAELMDSVQALREGHRESGAVFVPAAP